MATKKTNTEAPQHDLHALLLDGLKAEGIPPTVKWSPGRKYASWYVGGKANIAYVFAQNRNGVRVEPAFMDDRRTRSSVPRPRGSRR